jgi:gliding motility-associated lipoprotein GldD
MSFIQQYTILLFFCTLLLSCGSNDYTPKQRAYPKAALPAEHTYQTYQYNPCPFTFEYPSYAKMVRDTVFFNEPTENPCWMDINFDGLDASLHLSYKEIKGKNTLAKLAEDAHKMNSKHVIRADFMEDSLITTPNGVEGMYYTVGGNAASPIQFVLSDTVQHFVWASLYFNSTPNADSIAPILKFVKKDVDHLIQTFKWK